MTNEDDTFGLEAMFASTNITIADIQAGHLSDVNQLSRMDKLTTSSTFAALLATPQLQANAYRLEALVHIAVAESAGRQHLTSEFVRKVFKRFGNGICGRLEDPAEDLFTTVVHSSNGNFVVLEGLREGNGFYLQRVLDVLEDIPDRGRLARMRRSVFALLALADAVAARAGLVHGMIGKSEPHSDLPRELLSRLNGMRQWVRFSHHDLEQMGVDVRDLSPFILQPGASMLEDEPLADSPLQRHPVLLFGDVIYLALPTSVGTAITRYVVSTVASSGNLKVFETSLALKYWDLLSWTPFVDMREPPPFQPRGESALWVGSTLRQVEPGRYVHLVVLVLPLNASEEESDEFAYAASMELSHLAMEEIQQASQGVPGIGDVQLIGSGDYAMRLWLNPNQLASRGLTAADVVNAVREQNVQVSAGQLGAEPSPKTTELLIPINVQGRLRSEKEFGDIVLKDGADGQIVHLSDVARVELGASDYTMDMYHDNKNGVAIGIFLTPGANALGVATSVYAQLHKLSAEFPAGMVYKPNWDPTVFVRESIRAVEHTLIEAVVLVVLVVILFLQTWRASIIPLVAVPVSVVGTFAFLYLLGYSINTLTLFGLVLAIGIVVDDAIVVVENVERNIQGG
jgi:hypothetical protein